MSAAQYTASGKKVLNRGWVLACAAICGGITGSIYMWSLFRNPLQEATGMSVTTVTFAYSLFLIFVLIGNVACGPLSKRIKTSTIVSIGGIGFGLGWLLTGWADTPFKLYLFYSFIGGISDGFVYNATVSVVNRWFPDKRGFANGICIGAMGFAPVIFAPFGGWLIESFDVFTAFKICGILFLAVRFIFGWFVKNPPEDYRPAGWTEEQVAIETKRDTPTGKMLQKPTFWLLWVYMVFAAVSGVIFTGHAAAIGQEQCNLTAAEGALLVSILALASFLGRFTLGSLSDKIGRYPTLIGVLVVTAVDMLFFMSQTNSFLTFGIAIFVIGMGFGAVMAITPSLVSETFGNKYFSGNWPFVYSGYTLASFIGPMMAAAAVQAVGGYSLAYLVGGGMAVLGVILLAILMVTEKKRLAVVDAS